MLKKTVGLETYCERLTGGWCINFCRFYWLVVFRKDSNIVQLNRVGRDCLTCNWLSRLSLRITSLRRLRRLVCIACIPLIAFLVAVMVTGIFSPWRDRCGQELHWCKIGRASCREG